MTRTIPSSGTVSSPGVALVVTLMMMSVLVMMVVGLAGVMRNEQAAARNLTYQVLAEQLAEVGVRQGMTAVLTSTPAAGQITATGPGWIQAGNTTRYLFSPAASASSDDIKNLERIGTNSLILGLPSGVLGSIFAGWSNLTLPGQPANRPFARYAWWVDDEGTKLNLNAVGSNNTEGFLPLLTNFPFSADWVFVTNWQTGQTNQTNANQAQALRSRLQWLPTPEVLKSSNFLNFTNAQVSDGTNNVLTGEQYHPIKGHVTTWSSNVDLTPWGAPKLALNANLSLNEVVAALNTNALSPLGFTNPSSLAVKYGAGNAANGALVITQIAANILAAQGRPVVLGAGDYVTVPNLTSDSLRTRHGLPSRVASLTNSPSLDEVHARADYLRTGNRIGIRLAVGVQIINPYDQVFNNYSLQVRPRKFRFNITSPTDMQAANSNSMVTTTLFAIPNTTTYWEQNGRSVWGGPSTLTGTEFFFWPWGSPLSTNGLTLNPRSTNFFVLTGTFICTYTTPAASSTVSQAYAILDQVALYAGPPGTPNLVDWMSLDDLNQEGNYRTAPPDPGQFNFSGPRAPALVATFTNVLTRADFTATGRGLKKLDPQTRFPTAFWADNEAGIGVSRITNSLQAWTTTLSPSLTATNGSVTGISYLWPDPAPGVTAASNHPHFVAGFRPTNGLRSVAQLGAIHTGLPWRTLRLGPTPAAELAQGPPDWIVLDLFTATNPTVALPRVNLNGLITSLQTASSANPGVPRNSTNQIQVRPWPLLGTMGALRTNLTFTNTNAAISNGVITSMSTNTNAIFSTNRFLQIAASLSNVLSAPNQAGSGWEAGSGWSAWRAALSNNYPPNGFGLVGEVLETSHLAHDGGTVGEDIVEGRLRGFLDMLTTRSDTFSVWSIGQGLVVVTNAAGTPIRTNVMGEVRKQTVFQRVPMFNPAGTEVTNYQARLLYTRNHVAE